jgi:dephospho-CoA kinase
MLNPRRQYFPEPGIERIVCVCGRPLSGKTTVARLLREKLDWRVIEADDIGGSVLQEESSCVLFDEEADGTAHRYAYPYDDALLMEWERPEMFMRQMSAAIESGPGPLLVVGLRSTQVVGLIKRVYPETSQVLYVSAGIRVCSARYAALSGKSRRSYQRRLDYAVEADQPRLRKMANVVLHNGASLESLEQRLLARVREDGRIFRGKLEHCSFCHELLPVHYRIAETQDPVCKDCYEMRFNSQQCSLCRAHRPVHSRDESGNPICKRCYQRVGNVRSCAHCGRARPVHCRDAEGAPVCRSCSNRLFGDPRREVCSRCGKRGRVARRSAGAPVCGACLEQGRRGAPAQSAGVSQTATVVARVTP